MWIDDIKDNPVAKWFVETASKERIEAVEREAFAKGFAKGFAQGMAKGPAAFLVRYAVKHNVALIGSVEVTENLLAAHADEEALYAMFKDMPNMANHKDMASFMTSHGVSVCRT